MSFLRVKKGLGNAILSIPKKSNIFYWVPKINGIGQHYLQPFQSYLPPCPIIIPPPLPPIKVPSRIRSKNKSLANNDTGPLLNFHFYTLQHIDIMSYKL